MLIFLWVIFILSMFGVVLILLSKLPASIGTETKIRVNGTGHENFWSYLGAKSRIFINQIWHFILEAKDLRPSVKLSLPVEKMKNVFRIKIRSHENEPSSLPEAAELVESALSAEALYLKAIKNDPQNKEAYESLGRLYLQEKNYSEAEEIFEYLAKFDPGRDVYFSNLALSFYSQQKYPQAASAYEKALNLNNKIPARWINLGLTFMATGEYAKAIKAVGNALDLDKRNLNYMMLLADLYLKAHNSVRSEQVLAQVLEIDPTNRLAREKLMKLRI